MLRRGRRKTCSRCHKQVGLHKNTVIRKGRDGTYTQTRLSQIYSVIRCNLNECTLRCMDRDVNASKNILHLLRLQTSGEKRPECFLCSSGATNYN